MADTSTGTKNGSKKKVSKRTTKAASKKVVDTTPAPAPAATPSPAPAPSPMPTPTKGSGKGLSIFAILLSLLALGGTGFTWYQTQLSKVASNTSLAVGVTEIGGQISRIGDSVRQLQKEQTGLVTQEELTTRILESNVAVESKFRDLSAAQNDINKSLEKLNTDLEKGVNEFVIDEVSQLLKLANK